MAILSEKNIAPRFNALAFTGVNFSLKRFIAAVKKDPLEASAPDGCNNLLLTLTAHSATRTSVWLAKNAQELNIDIDYQDTCRRSDNDQSEELKSHIKEMGMDDQSSPLDALAQGKHLRNTALILAVKKGWDHRSDDAAPGDPTLGALILSLLKAGANVNIQDGCGNTALHIAVLKRDYRAADALLENGASMSIVNNAGMTPTEMLKIPYAWINPFLYHQTGGDTNSYIHTLPPERNWSMFNLQCLNRVFKKHEERSTLRIPKGSYSKKPVVKA